MRPLTWGLFGGFKAASVWGWTDTNPPAPPPINYFYNGGSAKVAVGGLTPSFELNTVEASRFINPSSGSSKVTRR